MYKTGRVNSTQITNVEPPSIPGERCLQYRSKPQRYKNEVYLFIYNPELVFLDEKKADIFHRTVAKLLWASLRARPDILLAISFLTSRVKKPDEDDWDKLTRLVIYIQWSIDLKLRLSSSGLGVSKW